MDEPPKLSAQVRVFATGNGRKTGPVDAHSVAITALRSPGLPLLPVTTPSDRLTIAEQYRPVTSPC